MSLPTHLELATLAANLPSGEPRERVHEAYLIWRATAAKLIELNETPEEKYHREREANIYWGEDRDAVPFVSFLAKLMPRIKTKAARIKRWREFLMQQFKNNEEVVETIMGRYPADGVDEVDYHTLKFKKWEAAEKKKITTKRAKKAGNARWLKHDQKK